MKRTPNIRFKGFEGEWEESTLSKYLEVFDKKNKDEALNAEDILSVSGEYGVVNQIAFHGKSFAGASLKGYRVTENGNILYTKSPLRQQPYGIIKANKYGKGIVSSLYAVYSTKNDVDSSFVQEYFKLDARLNSYLLPLINKGAKNTILVSDDEAILGKVIFPKPNEQKAISSFLENIDALISKREKEVEKMRNIKKALLEKMFPQGDEKVPQIRFGEFKEEWKEKELSSYLDVSEERNAKNQFGIQDVLSVSGDYGVVNQIEFQGRSFAGASLLGYRVLHKGEVVYTKSPLKANPFGIIKSNKYCDGIVSSLYGVYHVKEANADFIQDYFDLTSRLNAYLRPLVNKGAKNTLLITDEGALKGLVSFPKEKEQNAISNFIRVFDKMLSARDRQVTLLKNMKRALLEQMFVNE